MKKQILSLALSLIFIFVPGLQAIAATEQEYEAVHQWNLAIFGNYSVSQATQAYYKLPSLYVQSDDKDIIALANSITNGISSDYDKVKAIHDWVSNNIWYDYDSFSGRSGPGINSAVSTLQSKLAVCEGFTNLTAALLRAAGIPARNTLGFVLHVDGAEVFFDVSRTGTSHAWNHVFVDGRWIIIDTTWDSNNRYEYGTFLPQTDCSNTYFDISLKEISKNHKYFDTPDYSIENGIVVDNRINEAVTMRFDLFSDTVEDIVIPDGVTSISNSAFDDARMWSVKSIYLPASVKSILGGPFSQLGDFTIYGAAGSYAETYAKENNIKFVNRTPQKPIDTASSWARDGIVNAVSKGFVPEALQDNYANVITRAEFCRMALKWVEFKTGKSIDALLAEKNLTRGSNVFTDTNNPDILAAYALGITSGTTAPTAAAPGKFTPDGQFSREQAATMIRNTCSAAGVDIGNVTTAGFEDIGNASSWAVDSINFCYSSGIMSGTSTSPRLFSPKATYTREQSIITFNNIK